MCMPLFMQDDSTDLALGFMYRLGYHFLVTTTRPFGNMTGSSVGWPQSACRPPGTWLRGICLGLPFWVGAVFLYFAVMSVFS